MQVVSVWCRGERIVEHVEVASSTFERMRGLLGRDALAPGSGMLITRCGSIHTVGMQFSLDLIFIGRDGVVKRVVRDVKPGRWMVAGRGAVKTLELQSGWLPEGALVAENVIELR